MSTATTRIASGGDPVAALLSAPRRPDRVGRISASLTFAWRALLKVKHVPEQLFDVLAIPVIFTLMFTYLFGGALAGSTADYLRFLLPGSLAMTVILITMYTGFNLNTDVTRGVFDRIRSTATWRPAPIVGAMIGDVGRYVIASALVVGIGLALGFRPAGGIAGMLGGLALVLVFALALSWVWTTIGLVMRTPSAVMNAGFMIQFPLTLASNVFVTPKTMPGWLRAFVDANPVTHLVTAVRSVVAGAPNGSEIAWVLVASAAIAAVFVPLTLSLYARRI
jgi:ABC-2 type transport system permease protein